MYECQSCGNHVTEQFARTFGDNTNTVHACPECANKSEIKNGKAAAGTQIQEI